MSQTPTLDQVLATLRRARASARWDGLGEDVQVIEWLAESLPSLLEDKARIDWLEHEGDVELSVTHIERHNEIRWRDGLRPSSAIGPTLREAIDAAKSPSVPSAPPLR